MQARLPVGIAGGGGGRDADAVPRHRGDHGRRPP
jgi:hypothetical protein